MLFHSFNNQEERRAFGGSEFLELQFCQLERGIKIKSIVSTKKIEHWNSASLYVHGDDFDAFYEHYKDVFKNGTYNNLKSGNVDFFGINYYSPEQVDEMINVIKEKQPKDYQVVLDWLNNAKVYNGVYILGV